MYNNVAHVEEQLHAPGEYLPLNQQLQWWEGSLVLSKVGNQMSLPFWYVVLWTILMYTIHMLKLNNIKECICYSMKSVNDL